MQSLVAQFIALRHEVNLQTKASRASVEQNAEALKRLDSVIEELQNPPEAAPNDDETKPLLKALVDVYDALALSLQHVERQKAVIHEGLDTVMQAAPIDPPPDIVAGAPARRGFWQRLVGTPPAPSTEDIERWREQVHDQSQQRAEKVRVAVDFLKQALDGLITGYSMSLSRIDRVLPQFGLERIECVGERFDPETMEVIDVVSSGEFSAGEVVEEVRRGYRLNDSLFRYAQVRVAK